MIVQTDIIKFDEQTIYASGYGFAPKFAIQDTSLSIAAKAVYLYFCSLTGGSYSVYPTRAQILNDLAIGKDKYYAAMKNLTEQNYIHITKEKTAANKFEHNIYHLNLNPKQYVIDDKLSGDMIYVEGLLSGGAGMLSYRVMKSRAISCTEKVIYGYIVSFMGAGNTRMPKREEILKHLDLSEKTYKRAISRLNALELVKYTHARDSLGRIAGARYEIILTPSTWTTVSREEEESILEKETNGLEQGEVSESSEPWGQTKDTQNEPWGQTKDTQNKPWGQTGDTQNKPWGQTGDTQNKPWGQTGDTQNKPWGQTGDTQNKPWGQTGDTQKLSMGSKQGHYQDINTSSIYQTTTTKDIKQKLIQKIIDKTVGEDVVETFEEYLKSSTDKPCLSDLERMVIEYISELFVFSQGVQSGGLNRPYEYLESKTLKAIEEDNFAKVISRIVETYEQRDSISYPQGWVQSVYARMIGTTQWDISPGNRKKLKSPKNGFHNFKQRDTNYESLVFENVNQWLNEGKE